MIKFIIAARRKPQDTQERYFYEWGIIHVALMVTSPAVMRTFKRYVQHYSISGVSDDMLIHPLSPMAWDNMADHWMERLEDMAEATRANDYMQRMQPHVFGDKEFVLQLATGEVIFEEEGFTPGGIKLIHFLKKKPEFSLEEFNRRWRGQHAAAIQDATRGLVRKYVQNPQLEFERSFFKGTLFEHGGVNTFAGVEEFWFGKLDDLARLRCDPRVREAILASEASFVDPADTFSMVTTERVIYDYTLSDRSSPPPAVLNPDSLEAAIYRQGLRDWNIPPAPKKQA
jgi:hypothetical protein